MTTQTRRTVSERIMAIRIAAGGSADVCCTCGHRAEAPYRRIIGGRIHEGCVDAIHTGRLVSISGSNDWQNRKEAEKIRRATLDSLSK